VDVVVVDILAVRGKGTSSGLIDKREGDKRQNRDSGSSKDSSFLTLLSPLKVPGTPVLRGSALAEYESHRTLPSWMRTSHSGQALVKDCGWHFRL
jgi:hypothetical protein